MDVPDVLADVDLDAEGRVAVMDVDEALALAERVSAPDSAGQALAAEVRRLRAEVEQLRAGFEDLATRLRAKSAELNEDWQDYAAHDGHERYGEAIGLGDAADAIEGLLRRRGDVSTDRDAEEGT